MPKKINPDGRAHENILKLYTHLLVNAKPISLKDLTQEFKVHKSTMLRYLNSLEHSAYGKIVVETHGRENYYSIERPKKLPQVSLSIEGLQQLALCRDFIAHLLPPNMREHIEITLNQAIAYLPTGTENTLQGLPTIASSFTRGKIEYGPFQDALKSILTAIRDKDVCEIKYKKDILEDKSESFEYAPVKVIALGEAIHIIGWKVTSMGTVKPIKEHSSSLLLHRVENVTLTKRKSENLPQITEHKEGYFGFFEGDPFSVQIKFMNSAALYVAERTWSSEQKIIKNQDGSIVLNLTAQSEIEIISWVLGFGPNAKILSPSWLENKVAQKAQELFEIYKK